MPDTEEELVKLTPEYELIQYLIQRREDDINKLKPKSNFKINITEHPILSTLLEEEQINFRTTVRKAIIKAFSIYKLDESRADLNNKVKEVFGDIGLEIRIPQSVNIEEIKAEKHEGRIITFPCEIYAVEEPETITTRFLFRCPDCGDEQTFTPRSGNHVCGICDEDMINERVAESETVRTITVKELNSADNTPIMFTTDFHREITNSVEMNQKIMLTGIFKSIPPTTRNKHNQQRGYWQPIRNS